jgi:predicted alpha/beta superfamily hydrolase
MPSRATLGLLWVALAFAALPAFGQEPLTLYNSQVRRLHSNLVGIDYKLYVTLPRGYESQPDSYPVAVILDPDYLFDAVHHAAWVLGDHDELRPMILVGVAYPGGIEAGRGTAYRLNRTRDYTPTHVADGGYGSEFQKVSGGADRFLDFMTEELLPFLETNYRVKRDDRTLIGLSYGGLLATYSLLTRPGLFQRFVIVSPSLWYDQHLMSRIEARVAQSGAPIRGRAFFAVGGQETTATIGYEMVKDLESFVGSLESRHHRNLQVKRWVAPDETHHTVFAGAVMRGLQWIFSNSGQAHESPR